MPVEFETNPILSFVAGDEPQAMEALQIADGSDWDSYCKIKAMNGSKLWYASKSMLHLKHAIETDIQPTPPMMLGTVSHVLLLEPTEFEKRFCVMPNFHLDPDNLRKAKNKAETDEDRRTDSKATTYYKRKAAQFYSDARDCGQEVVTREQYDKGLTIVESVWANTDAAGWLKDPATRKEVTVIGEIEGVICKGRIDALHPCGLIDLKTTRANDERWFGRFAYDNGYLFKQAIHRELVRQMVGATVPVYYIPVENEPPHDCSFMEVRREDEQIFDQELERARKWLRQYRKCLETEVWPGRDGGNGSVELYLPDYAMDPDHAGIQDCEVVEL